MLLILVVEDERVLAELIQSFLEDDGYAVAIAANGQEALVQIARAAPELILSDLMMPVMDGLTLCHRLQQDARYEHVPIVLMSAAGQPPPGDRHCYQGFVPKPFDLDRLLDMVASLTSGSG